MLQLLGDELIGSARLAVFELVKNAYDADANEVVVTLDLDSDPEPTITVADDGEGMTLDLIRSVWLVPGDDHRRQQRLSDRRTPRHGRLPLGEKGLGRFADHEQPTPPLRDAEIRRIQHMRLEAVAQAAKALDQLVVARPGAHVDHVFQDQPAGAQRAGVVDDQHGGGAAVLAARRAALGAAVIGAFRRRQQDVDLARLAFQGVRADGLQAAGEDARVREVGGEGRGRGRAHVDAGGDLDSGRPRPGAAAAGPAEDVERPDHPPPTGRTHRAKRIPTASASRASHSQTIRTRQPRPRSASSLRRSRATFSANFPVQNATRDLGV